MPSLAGSEPQLPAKPMPTASSPFPGSRFVEPAKHKVGAQTHFLGSAQFGSECALLDFSRSLLPSALSLARVCIARPWRCRAAC